jgi:predicted RNA binding protein YcfA (HicA-like mRNA interferase family)
VPDGFYLLVARELSMLGFARAANAKGSHEKWVNGQGRTLIVPRNLKSRHTANGILKDAGSTRRL